MNKKKVYVSLFIALITLILGVSYAWFNYYQEGTNKKLVMGDLYLNLTSGNDQIQIGNVFPMTPQEARAETNNTLTFTIEGKNTTDKDIYYEIKLIHGEDDNVLERFNDKDLRFDLVEIINNEEVYLLDNVGYDDISNKRIWVDTVDADTQSVVEKSYKLRMWVADNVVISDTDPNRSYYATGEHAYNNHYASVKIAVYGDFVEKEVNSAYQYVKRAYDDNKASLFTLAHQDSLEGIGHQNVYYYTEDTYSNVLFNDTCWQIVRTTDTGGVKLLYNGLPEEKRVYASYKTLADTDISISTNTANYPYTFSNGKWTSGAVPNSGTGTLEFTVNEAGYYIINYDVSTEIGNDVMYIYKDNVLLRQDTGTIEDGIRLGNLTTSNVIKIVYKKNASKASGRDNIIIEIQEGQGTYETKTSCDTKRLPTTGLIGTATTSNLGNGTYKYGTTYTYTSSGFTLGGTIEDALWSDTTYENLLGKYTCATTSTTCTTLYYVQTYNSNTQAGVSKYTIGITRKYNEIGTSDFNEHYSSVSGVGYMYNNMYEYKTNAGLTENVLLTYTLNTSHKYSSSVSWTNNRYELSNGSTIGSYANAIGKYTTANTNNYNSSVRYIVGVSGSKGYYINLNNAGTHDLEYFNTAYTYGSSYTEENGQYRINSATTINKMDWYTGYTTVKNKYLCPGNNSLCNKEDLRYVTDNSNAADMHYFKVDTVYRFGHDVTYSNGTYTLTGETQDIANWGESFTANNNILQNTHYTCFNEEGNNICGDKVYFVYWTDAGNIRYIELTNGKKKDDALYEMLNYKGSNASKVDANINKYDSAIKQVIDHWYVNSNLTSKSNKIEDTVYCNDRAIRNNDLRNWDLSKTTKESWTLYFRMYDTNPNTNTLTCSNETDKFSVRNSKAKLTYPVGLLTEQERALMVNKSGSVYAGTGLIWWSVSPYGVNANNAMGRDVRYSGTGYNYPIYADRGVRPVVSLSPDTEFSSGSGTYDDPFVIE